MSDQRRTFIYDELSALDGRQLQRVLDTPDDQLVCDTFSYDVEAGTYCPMAVAFGIPELGPASNEMARGLIADRLGKPLRSTSGLPGVFYTTDRVGDIKRACRDILNLRDRES